MGISWFGFQRSCVPGKQDSGHHNRVGASSGRNAKALVRAVFYFNQEGTGPQVPFMIPACGSGLGRSRPRAAFSRQDA